MKVAILSDIHGNVQALETVIAHIDAWQPDTVIVNGDIVNRGPRPLACWRLVQTRLRHDGWLMTRGNHEEYVMAWAEAERRLSPYEAEIFQSSRWTYRRMGGDVDAMRSLPFAVSLRAPDRSELRAVHASMGNIARGVLPWTPDKELRKLILPAPTVFVTSHTHRFFTRHIDETLVVNSGSVGCPLDGDARTGYARVTWRAGAWHAELVRLDYDRDATRGDFAAVNFAEACGPMGQLMYREWEEARSHMPFWGRDYAPLAASGELTLAQSVDAYLEMVNHAS